MATQRVVMLWPEELKEQVRDIVTKDGSTITDFVVKAVEVHLGQSQDLGQVEKEVNEVRHFAQQLADQLVLGVNSPEERLQTLMEIDFPSWIDTSGWPSNFAERVRPEFVTPPVSHMGDMDDEPGSTHQRAVTEGIPSAPTVVRRRKDEEVSVVAAEIAVRDKAILDRLQEAEDIERAQDEIIAADPTPAPEEPVAVAVEPAPVVAPDRDDMFARIMAKAGGKRDDVPGLKLASEVAKPEPKEDGPNEVETQQLEAEAASAAGLCATCGDELIDGECWSCG